MEWKIKEFQYALYPHRNTTSSTAFYFISFLRCKMVEICIEILRNYTKIITSLEEISDYKNLMTFCGD